MLEIIKNEIKKETNKTNENVVTIAISNDSDVRSTDEALELIEDCMEELYLEGYKVNEDIVSVDNFNIYYHIELV